MKLHLLLSILYASLLPACSIATDSDTTYDPHVKAFKQSLVTLTASSQKVVPGQLVTITTHFTPLVTGKGIIGMAGYGEYPNSSWQIESPLWKLFTTANMDSTALYALDFTANQPIDLQWRVRLLDRSGYHILADVWLDSVFIADSGRMYHIKSDEAMRITDGNGYNYKANGDYIDFFP